MNIKELFENKKVVFSFEIFPPKTTSSIETIYKTLDSLKGLSPDYMSITFGQVEVYKIIEQLNFHH